VIHNKYKKLKSLVLKLKPSRHHQDLSSLNPDQLDTFVDEMIDDLRNNLISNTNDLRERIKQARPDPNDPQYDAKMMIYKELLEQMIPVMQKLQDFVGQILDELHALVRQLWDDISKNDGKEVDRLLEEHERRTEAHINERWMKNCNEIEIKLRSLVNMTKDNTKF
jgi:archaellum component FlaC